MSGLRNLERVNIDIDINTASGQQRSLKLDEGVYSRFQVINRFNNNLDVPVEIEIVADGHDVVQKVDLRALETAGGDFYESKAPIHINGRQNLDIYLTAASDLAAAGSYQIVFWKEQC